MTLRRCLQLPARSSSSWLPGRPIPHHQLVQLLVPRYSHGESSMRRVRTNPISATDVGIGSVQGVNIMAFCKEYNAATSKMAGDVIPVEITVYEVSSVLLVLPHHAPRLRGYLLEHCIDP